MKPALRSQAVAARARPGFSFPPPVAGRVDVLFIAGEHSGDQQAASLARELRREHPDLALAALGGPDLAAAEVQVLHDMTNSSVVGLVEVLKHYGTFRALFEETLRWIAAHRPLAVCFVDYPGFNLRLARALYERKLAARAGGPVKLFYYISPQIWAWKARRRFPMARHLDALAVIFPFEVECYADTSLPVSFVGHPFVTEGYVPPVRYDPDAPVLLLPGSRQQAVARIFPRLLAGYRAWGGGEAVAIYPSEEIAAVLRAANPPPTVRLVPNGQPVAASAVLTSSGTMSLHCALAGIPGAIAYRANPVTYWLGRCLVSVPYLGIANLLLHEPMYPEYIQGAATPAVLARELQDSRDNPQRRERAQRQAERLQTLLRRPAGATPADWLWRHLASPAIRSQNKPA